MKRNSIIKQGLILGIVLLPLFSWSQNSKTVSADKKLKGRDAVPEFMGKTFRFQTLAGQNSDGTRGIGLQKGVTRRDPSDVIKVGNTYYVWYNKITHAEVPVKERKFRPGMPIYVGRVWYATSQDEGHTWVEQGKALGVGKEGAWDSHAVFAPNILKYKNKYYLYHNGVMPTPGRTDGMFENNSTTDYDNLGIAVADSPDGPWKRITDEPILRNSPDKNAFDSFRVCDACLLVRDGKIWLYYKGRALLGRGTAGQTRMGVAFAEKPEGPYVRYKGNPILAGSHEVMIWPHREGVAAYASLSQTFEYAPDGLDFTSNKVGIGSRPRPIAPGTFRPDLTDPNETVYGTGARWGISMLHPGGPYPYLVRWECDLTVPKAGN